MGHRPMTYDEERFSINTAWMKKSGQHFEVVVEPDAAVAYKENGKGDVREIVKSKHVYTDAKKGELASETLMKNVFGTADGFEVAEKIISEGEVQLTKEYRDKMREQKKRKVVALIMRNAIDPRTKSPIPQTRLELAMDEAKIRLEDFKSAEDQVRDVVRKLQPILPIKFEHATLEVIIPSQYAPKLYGIMSSWGTVKQQSWQSDGGWAGEIEMPAGMVTELIDLLNSRTHGGVQVINKTK